MARYGSSEMMVDWRSFERAIFRWTEAGYRTRCAPVLRGFRFVAELKITRNPAPVLQVDILCGRVGSMSHSSPPKTAAKIFYKDWGQDAQPIVFHHGWPLCADDWDAQMMFFLDRAFASSPTTVAATALDQTAAATTWTPTPPTPPRWSRPSTSGRDPRRPFHGRRRGRPLRRPPRQGPRGEGGPDQRRSAAHAQDGRQPGRHPRSRCSTAFAQARRQPRPVLSRFRQRPLLRIQPDGREALQGVIRTGGARP